MPQDPTKTIMLVDGSSLIHRAFYALPLLTNAAGQYTNAVYGFVTMLNKLCDSYKPVYLAVCLDKGRITFRNDIYPAYKAQRDETPIELRGQFELVKDFLAAADIFCLAADGFEADDLLGTLAARAADEGIKALLVSGDKDLLQLIDDNTSVVLTKKGVGETALWDGEAFKEHYGLPPAALVDLKGLMGDSSDNIPGVSGVGEKTALKLLWQYGSIDALYDDIDALPANKLKEKLQKDRDMAFLSRRLATIEKNAPPAVSFPFDALRRKERSVDKLAAFYRSIGSAALLRDLQRQTGKPLNAPAKAAAPLSKAAPQKATYDPLTDELPPWGIAEGELPFGGEQTAPLNQAAPSAPLNQPMQPEQTAPEPAAQLVQPEAAAPLNQAPQPQAAAPLEQAAIRSAADLPVYPEGSWVVAATWEGHPHLGQITGLTCASDIFGLYYWQATDGPLPTGLQILLQSEDIPKVVVDAKEVTELLRASGVQLTGSLFDPVIAAYLIDPAAPSYDLASLTDLYGLPPQAEPALAALRLMPLLSQRLDELQQTALFKDIEMPLTRVLADMEFNGIRVDGERLQALGWQFAQRTDELTQEIYALAGQAFNINSPKQLGYILFEKMGLPSAKKTKTGYSTDSDVLVSLAPDFAIADKVLQYRSYNKLKTTYTDGLFQLIQPQTGRIHTNFKQTVTATGRLSSVAPNLQNIPVREEQGRLIRSVFIASDSANVLLAADYNQIELRVLAHLSGDERLLDAFRSGSDIHRSTAAEVFGIDPDEVTASQRRQAKAVNFGIIYGMSDYGLSRDIGVSRAVAADYIRRYFERYPKVRSYQEGLLQQGRSDGFVATVCGRRRYLPDLNNRNYNLRSNAERMALNTPIQGSAADIIKLAMLAVYRQLLADEPDCRLLLQVHDELIFELPRARVADLAPRIKALMQDALPLSLPLTVELKVGDNWDAMQKTEVT